MEYLKFVTIVITLLGIGFVGITIKIWSKKNGKFAGTCASQNPYLNESGEPCSYCGKPANKCEKKNKNL